MIINLSVALRRLPSFPFKCNQSTNQSNLSPLSIIKHLFLFLSPTPTPTPTPTPPPTPPPPPNPHTFLLPPSHPPIKDPSKMPSICKTPKPAPDTLSFGNSARHRRKTKPRSQSPLLHIFKPFSHGPFIPPSFSRFTYVCSRKKLRGGSAMQCKLCQSKSIHLSINLNSRGAFVVTNHRCR